MKAIEVYIIGQCHFLCNLFNHLTFPYLPPPSFSSGKAHRTMLEMILVPGYMNKKACYWYYVYY